MWQGTWDPEGLFSTIPAIATGIIGMLVGTLLLSQLAQDKKIIWLFTLGFIMSILGYWWDLVFPINKNLWTSSYVLVTSGLASMTLASLLFLIDGLGYKKFAGIGIIFGANAITIYVLSDLLTFLFYRIPIGEVSLNVHFMSFGDWAGLSMKFVSFIYALLYITINFIPAYFLFKKKLFIKL